MEIEDQHNNIFPHIGNGGTHWIGPLEKESWNKRDNAKELWQDRSRLRLKASVIWVIFEEPHPTMFYTTLITHHCHGHKRLQCDITSRLLSTPKTSTTISSVQNPPPNYEEGRCETKGLSWWCWPVHVLLGTAHGLEVFISAWQLIAALHGLVLLAKCLRLRLRLYQEHAGCQRFLQSVRVDGYGKGKRLEER